MAQIGTIKLQTQSNGVVTLPVFDTADAGSNVYDMVRVQTPSGVGFIPFVAPSDASRPYLRVQTQNQGVLAAHDKASMGVSTGFETPGDWTVTSQNGNASINTSNPRSGSYSFESDPNNNDKDHIATYDAGLTNTKFAEADFYYYPGNGNYYAVALVVREGSAGGDALLAALTITSGSGKLKILEGQVGSYTVLTSTSVSQSINAGSWNSVYMAVKEGASSGDVYGEITIGGNTYTTSDVTPNITSGGRVGLGEADVTNTGGQNYFDDENITKLG